MSSNPIEKIQNYRSSIIQKLPNLEMFDEININEKKQSET